jgi:conjugal transfer pilus assembly protein TraD
MSNNKNTADELIEGIIKMIFAVGALFLLKVPQKLFSFGRDIGLKSRASAWGVVFWFILIGSVVPGYMFLSGDLKFSKGRTVKKINRNSVMNKGGGLTSSEESYLWGIFFEFLALSYGLGYLVGGFSYSKVNASKNSIGNAVSLLGGYKFLHDPNINNSILNNHQLILGSSGAGKTYFVLEGQIADAIGSGETVFIIDPKGDVGFRDAIFTWCQKSGRSDDFKYFSMSNPEVSDAMNPFGDCKVNEIKDMIISATDWSEPHYRKMAEVSIMKALLNRKIDSYVTISEIVDSLPDSKELLGLKADLELMKLSDFGSLIDNERGSSVFDFYAKNKVVFISLDVQAYPQASVQLGRIVMGAILALSNRVQGLPVESRVKTTVVVDEFGSFLTDSFVNFINKARSSNFRAILATQSVGDLERYSPEMRKQLLDSITNKVVLRMSDPDSIEFCAKMFGTKKGHEFTEQIKDDWLFGKAETGLGSSKEVEEFIVHPRDIRELDTGKGYFLVQDPYAVFRVLFYHPRPADFEVINYAELFRSDSGDSDAWESMSAGLENSVNTESDSSLKELGIEDRI